MKKRVSKKKLGRTYSHRSLLIKNQLRSLTTNGYVVTTSVKAKVLKTKIDELLNKVSTNTNELVVKNLLVNELGSEKLALNVVDYVKNGYTKVSIVKEGFRKGDNGETSRVSIVGLDAFIAKKSQKKAAKKVAKVEKTEAVEAVEEESKTNNSNQPENITSRIAKTFKKGFTGGTKERVRTRSGI